MAIVLIIKKKSTSKNLTIIIIKKDFLPDFNKLPSVHIFHSPKSMKYKHS